MTSVCARVGVDDEWTNIWAKKVGRNSQKGGEASYQLLNMTFPGWVFGPQQGWHLCACLSSPSAPQARWLNYLQQGTGPRDSQHSLLQPAKASPSWSPGTQLQCLPFAWPCLILRPQFLCTHTSHLQPSEERSCWLHTSELFTLELDVFGLVGAIFVHSVLSSLLTNSNAAIFSVALWWLKLLVPNNKLLFPMISIVERQNVITLCLWTISYQMLFKIMKWKSSCWYEASEIMIHFRELRHKPDQKEVIYWLGSLCQSSVSEISYFQSTAFNNVLLEHSRLLGLL